MFSVNMNKNNRCGDMTTAVMILHTLLYDITLLLQFLNVCIDDSHCSDVYDVAYACVEVSEVYRLVKTHLDRTDNLSLR